MVVDKVALCMFGLLFESVYRLLDAKLVLSKSVPPRAGFGVEGQ